jgi:hypothetical protein
VTLGMLQKKLIPMRDRVPRLVPSMEDSPIGPAMSPPLSG